MTGIGAALFVIFFIAMFALWAAAVVFWIMKLIEVATIPDYQYRAAGSEKIAWVLVVVFAGWVGALIWQFSKRQAVLDAAGYAPSTPPGWYPEPGTGAMRYWDGVQWTEHRQG